MPYCSEVHLLNQPYLYIGPAVLLGEVKNPAISGQKNHTTSRDKKNIPFGLNMSNKIKYDMLWSNMVQYGPIFQKKTKLS